ncbi:MAG: cyclic nucleotide-binding domain-containing protein [Elusimicrobia bacterium]|nr:cyclic nucleotide-binding domain-containing protein [Elusimicrobiota bacterium]
MGVDKLKNIEFFSSFDEEILQVLEEKLIPEQYGEKDLIFKEGDIGDSMYILNSGEVEITKEGRTLARLSAGSLFGEMSFFEADTRSASVIACGDVSLFKINNSDFQEFLFKYPDAGMSFLMEMTEEISRRLRRTSEYFITVFETGKILATDQTLTELSQGLLKRLMKDLSAETGAFMIYNRYTEFFDLLYSSGENAQTEEEYSELIEKSDGKTILVTDDKGLLIGEPIRENEDLLGYMFFQKLSKNPYSVEQKIALSAVANQAALGVRTAQNREEEAARRRLEEGRARGF